MVKCSLALMAVISAVLFSELRAQQPATQPTAVPRITLFAAVVRPGPTWLANQAAGRGNDMARHFEYVKTMRDQGKLVLGGPFADGRGGLLVYRADSLEQAQQYMDSDPATIDKVFEFDLHPWLVNAADLPQN